MKDKKKRRATMRKKEVVDALAHESIESFLRRGGTIKKVKAAWNMTPKERVRKKPYKNTWGNWGAYG